MRWAYIFAALNSAALSGGGDRKNIYFSFAILSYNINMYLRKAVHRLLLAGIVYAALGTDLVVRANGDDFFQKSEKPLESQLIFVGTVKDDHGNRISGALVTWAVDMTFDGKSERTYAGTYTNSIGRYRTVDVATTINKYGYDFDPALVELMVNKPGFIQTRSFRRTRHNLNMGLIEIDFELKSEELVEGESRDRNAAEKFDPLNK